MRAMEYGDELVGIRLGWKGLLEADSFPLNLELVEPIINQGGTILATSRTDPASQPARIRKCLQNAKKLGLDALIALGGEDTLGAAHKLGKHGLRCVGVPKTMDNDLNATDYTFGFDSAVSVGVDAADRLRDTARSHRRMMVLEVMGRHAGWVALHVGVCAGADLVLIPEVPLDVRKLVARIRQLKRRGKDWGLVVASEGVKIPKPDHLPTATQKQRRDEYQHDVLKGVGEFVARQIEDHAGIETRHVVLGHVMRGGPPTSFDRWLGTRVGLKAVDLVHQGKFDHMAALQGTEIVGVPLEAAVGQLKTVPPELYQQVKTVFSW
jgi:6-phosphofructokinase 1